MIGLNNVAPTELDKTNVKLFYYDIAPTEQMKIINRPRGATS